MDKDLERLNRIYPNCKYVLIPPYQPELWVDKKYDSSFDRKDPLNKWRTNPLTYDDAQAALNKGYRIGWIVPKGYVIIDIDNKEEPRSQEYIEKLLEKFEVKYSYNYSSKGIHILFQDTKNAIKSDSKSKCGLNLVVDTRANETGYIVLPSNDPHRAWGEWNDYVEELPYFLYPLLKDSTPSFVGMTDGDGRNNALFKWRSKLEQCNKLQPKEIEKCIRIINENLFMTAMPNSELFATVLKQRDKVEKPSVEDRENVYNKLAEEIISKFDIISFGDQFYKFNGTYYKMIDEIELERIIHFEVNKNINRTGRIEIIQFLRIKTQVPNTEFDKDWHKIACKNGILNLVTGEVTLPTKADINTIFIPYTYNEDPVYSPRIDQFMKELCMGDPLKMQFLYQIAGYTLLKKNMFEKFFIFKGEGGTGKSTFMNIIHRMVGGDTNCSHVGLSDMDSDYYLATTISKLVNLDDDVVDGKTLENTGRFKSIISGNIISVRQIYQAVVSFVPYITLMFSCNKLPRILDRTSGLYRRIVLIELNNKIKVPDPLFMNKITNEDMEYFLFKAVEGIKLAIEEGRFRISQSENELLKLFKRRQSPINEWLYETNMTIGDLHQKRCIPLYSQFKGWCENNGYLKIMSNFSFKEEICALYDLDVDFIRENEQQQLTQAFIKRGAFNPDWRPF